MAPSANRISVPHYDLIKTRLSAYRPDVVDDPANKRACVALILRTDSAIPEVFFIRRAVHKSDPWSGQIAFPGGGKEERDADMVSTACRETREEVGIRLDSGMLLGRLDDQQGKNRKAGMRLTVSCFVFRLGWPQKVTHNVEVDRSFWVPVNQLADDNRAFRYRTDYAGSPFPAIRIGCGQVLWGLTYRFAERFMQIVS